MKPASVATLGPCHPSSDTHRDNPCKKLIDKKTFLKGKAFLAAPLARKALTNKPRQKPTCLVQHKTLACSLSIYKETHLRLSGQFVGRFLLLVSCRNLQILCTDLNLCTDLTSQNVRSLASFLQKICFALWFLPWIVLNHFLWSTPQLTPLTAG